MLDFAYHHIIDITVWGAIVLVVFAIARIANASPLLAAMFAAAPVVVAWFVGGASWP